MRWAAILIVAILVSGCAAGTSATTSTVSPTPVPATPTAIPGLPDDCYADITEGEALARETLSFTSGAPIYSQSDWDATAAKDANALAKLRSAFAPSQKIRPAYMSASKVLVAYRRGPIYDNLRQRFPVNWTFQLFSASESLGVDSLDQIAQRYGVRAVLLASWYDKLGNIVTLDFCLDQRANFRAAVADLAATESAQAYRGDGFESDRPNLNMAARGDDLYAVVREAGGDCPAGCTTETISVFQISGDVISQLCDTQILADPLLVDLVASVRFPRGPWQGGGRTTCAASPTPTPAPTPAMLPDTGGAP